MCSLMVPKACFDFFFFKLVGVFPEYQLKISTETQLGCHCVCKAPAGVSRSAGAQELADPARTQLCPEVGLDPHLLDREGLMSARCTQSHQKVRTVGERCGLPRGREQTCPHIYLT